MVQYYMGGGTMQEGHLLGEDQALGKGTYQSSLVPLLYLGHNLILCTDPDKGLFQVLFQLKCKSFFEGMRVNDLRKKCDEVKRRD